MNVRFTPPVAALQRVRGPHPLPLFLSIAAEVTAGDTAQLARVLAGVRRYQAHDAVRTLPPMPEVARMGSVCLRDYGGSGPTVVAVPSLINPPYVLDLAAGNSLLRWLATQGLRLMLVDWGTPGAEELGLDLEGYVAQRLVPLIGGLPAPPALLGYCLGGTLALAAAALVPVTRLALLAAPWHFTGYGDDARAGMAVLWESIQPIAAALGSVPMELLQPAFWQLDPAALVAKYARLADADPAAMTAFAALEDWANAGPPLPLGVAASLFERLYAADLPGRGDWHVGTKRIDPAALGVPVIDIVSTVDRIVPATAAAGVGARLELDLGHVGMVVGSRARAQLWEPLAAWLRSA